MLVIPLTFTCGICGMTTCSCTIKDTSITVTCPACQQHINRLEKQVGDLEVEIFELQKEASNV